MSEQKTRVIVIGGGYAGVLAANHLRLNENVDITLVNPRDTFVERIRLHQLVTGSDDAVVDYSEILGDGIHLTVDSVARIDAPRRRIELARGDELSYDYLIYAIGSHGAAPVVPGAAEFAYPISELEHAQELKKAFHAAGETAPITVIGAEARRAWRWLPSSPRKAVGSPWYAVESSGRTSTPALVARRPSG